MSEKSHLDLEKMTIGKVPIGCLTKAYQGKDVAFRIPNYQRGYRWKTDDVIKLLNDLTEFLDESGKPNSRSFYCLQPLVVKKAQRKSATETTEQKVWEVVDGQQRLTTLFLIWKVVNGSPLYELSYDTRDRSRDFLNEPKPHENGRFLYMDFHHIYHAHQAIQTKFKDECLKNRFKKLLEDNNSEGRNVRFIWYRLQESDDAVEAFTRLNDRKIPLTDEELIRALFLCSREAGKLAEGAFHHRLALEWDRIETTLQEPDFWGFVSNRPAPEGGRIRLLLELRAPEGAITKNRTLFQHYEETLNKADAENLRSEWQKIVFRFEQLEEWYRDPELFHLVGYFTAILGNGSLETLRKLLEEAQEKTKRNFAAHLRESIRTELVGKAENVSVTAFVSGLNFDTKIKTRHTLALFNIATILCTQGVRVRFPFHLYHDTKNGWDIEHIQSQAADRMTDEDQTKWLEACKHELEHEVRLNPAENSESEEQKNDKAKLGDSLLAAIDEFKKEDSTLDFQGLEKNIRAYFREKEAELAGELLNAIEEYSKPDSTQAFSDLEKKIRQYFVEKDVGGNELHSIGNLTLLDAATNRSYGNAPFVVKRTKILETEKKGTFILPCTRDLFLKVFSVNAGNLRRWDIEKDGAAHKEAICKILETFFGEKEEEPS